MDAAWRLEEDGIALIEAAQACGLAARGRPGAERPASARRAAASASSSRRRSPRARERIVVAVGGSASTDGGLGAVEALRPPPLPVPIDVACDVEARFLDAADVFAPQKGATPEQVRILRERLAELAVRYPASSASTSRSRRGAAGGLAGGLAAIGARLLPGFDLVADRLGLDERLAEADLVVTGEGLLDATSFTGKVVGARARARASRPAIEALVVAGDVAAGSPIDAISLVASYGPENAPREPAECLTELVATALATRRNGA